MEYIKQIINKIKDFIYYNIYVKVYRYLNLGNNRFYVYLRHGFLQYNKGLPWYAFNPKRIDFTSENSECDNIVIPKSIETVTFCDSKNKDLKNFTWSNNVKEIFFHYHKVALENPSLPPNVKLLGFFRCVGDFSKINIPDDCWLSIDVLQDEFENCLPQNLKNLKISHLVKPLTNLPISLKELQIDYIYPNILEQSKIPYGCRVQINQQDPKQLGYQLVW